MLSCTCDYEDFEWWFYNPDDFIVFNRNRRKRCVSCNELIDIGSDCLEFECFRDPYSDIEEKIWGDEVQLANKYLCFDCGAIFLNLTSLGYCVSLGDHIKYALEEYWDLTGFEPKQATR